MQKVLSQIPRFPERKNCFHLCIMEGRFIGGDDTFCILMACDMRCFDLQDEMSVRHCTNAYMLVYIRDSHLGELCSSILHMFQLLFVKGF